MATVNTAWDHVSGNIFKTYLIMFFFSLFTIGVIYVIAQGFGYGETGGLGIVGFALIMAGIMNFASYYWSDKIVLGISGAKELKHDQNKEIYHLVENLCIAAGLPTPKIYIIEDTAPNAFATGRDPKHSAIALTSGIIQKLSKQELEGVIAHELSHVGNRDTLLMSVVSILVGTIALLADFFMRSMFFGGHNDRESRGNQFMVIIAIVAAILAPIVAILIQLAISRKREFLADASSVLLTRYPGGLASALQKISADREPLEAANRGTAHLYIVNPLKGKDAKQWLAGLFNTHPPIEARLKALREMEGLK
ncbi:zinc metalloprotease HtpX [Candidatus Daviesbacteria bacterium RIFOXYD1_FULL_41_10]|uniref:Protease HtpX homolog n=2 Tax=Candidatus Daviesiibacteriota TaxID=1752718 RepID=A0A1F5N0M1_9BACT|nr:MAG: Protease HtpX-like protein [Candidatus Daviesbacteria bacterium GW2011_GWB1_41_5]OGE71133.1 MAG: zinc metalloprotease HtpX [Candidatus Daviesbacteria bacterium RIFOXYD1_FULL_41_10]